MVASRIMERAHCAPVAERPAPPSPAPPAATWVFFWSTGAPGHARGGIVTQRPKEKLAFWQDIFNMRHSDDVHQRISGAALEFNFLRFNKRHHSIALGSTAGLKLNPFRTRIQHMEVQVATLEALVQAYGCSKKLSLTISFYVKTPCGFDFEYDWNPRAVDEQAWRPEVWDKISLWGHRPEGVDTLD